MDEDGGNMETVTIQLLNQNALKLLKQLEELHLIQAGRKENTVYSKTIRNF
ncbi:MAG TPA: hypothetical protein PKC10_04690 [Cyclobacteriaceae bacterium]|nr:hypothetical protein [Cyclobacteriaceae bacterium]